MNGSSLDGGGTLKFQSGADLILNNGPYSPGTSTLTVTGDGSRVAGTGTLTNASTLNVFTGANIESPLVNDGNILIQGDTSTSTNVLFSNSAINNGTLRIEALNDNSSLNAPVLTLSQGMTNNGRLELGTIGSGSLTNQTRIVIAGGTLVNAAGGEIIFEPGGTRTIDGPIDNQGTIDYDGGATIGVSGDDHENTGSLNLMNDVTINYVGNSFTNQIGATISSDGTLNLGSIDLNNLGAISPGQSPGDLTILGDLINSGSSQFLVEIGGLLQGDEYDHLTVTGSATLAGNLSLSLIDGFTPDPAHTFTILTAGSLAGQFDNAGSQVQFAGGTFDVSYDATSVELSNFVVPEPNTLTLIMLGSFLLWLGRGRASIRR